MDPTERLGGPDTCDMDRRVRLVLDLYTQLQPVVVLYRACRTSLKERRSCGREGRVHRVRDRCCGGGYPERPRRCVLVAHRIAEEGSDQRPGKYAEGPAPRTAQQWPLRPTLEHVRFADGVILRRHITTIFAHRRIRQCSLGPDGHPRRGHARSKRSNIMTLSHAATKSRTNFSFASDAAYTSEMPRRTEFDPKTRSTAVAVREISLEPVSRPS
jgi:hypothetical protein